MIRIPKILAVILALQLVACVSQVQNVEDVSARKTFRSDYAVVDYPNITPAQVFQAAEKVFLHLDPDAVTFDPQEDRLLVARDWSIYLVLSFTNGRDYFEIKTHPYEGGARVSIAATGLNSSGSFGGGAYPPFMSDIQVNGNNRYVRPGQSYIPFTADDYRLLHQQLAYFLGISQHWVTCDDINASLVEPNQKPYICFNGANFEFRLPGDDLAVQQKSVVQGTRKR